MNYQIFSKLVSLTFGVLVLSLSIGFYAFAVWTEPSLAPPDGNISTPLNVGAVSQSKNESLTFHAFYDYQDSSYYINPSSTAISALFASKVALKNTNIYLDVDASNNLTFTDANTPTKTLAQLAAGGAGVASYLDLDDTPSSYSGQAGKVVTVNAGATGLEFAAGGAGGCACGVIDSQGLMKSGDNFGLYNTCLSGQVLKWNGSIWECQDDNSTVGGEGAPTDARYIIVGPDNINLSKERMLAEGSGISILDGGDNGNITISVSASGITSSMVNFNYAGSSSKGGMADDSDKVDGYHYNSNWPTTLSNIQSACSNNFHNIGGTDADTWITTQTCPSGQYLSSVGKTTKICSTPAGGGGGFATCNEIETSCNYVNESGDTMTGALNMNWNNLNNVSYIYSMGVYSATPSVYSLGSSTNRWAKVYGNELCIGTDCRNSWPSGGGDCTNNCFFTGYVWPENLIVGNTSYPVGVGDAYIQDTLNVGGNIDLMGSSSISNGYLGRAGCYWTDWAYFVSSDIRYCDSGYYATGIETNYTIPSSYKILRLYCCHL